MDRRGIVIVISSPSGGGKGSILGRVLAEDDRLTLTVSATTRKPRQGDIDGQHYHFLSTGEFKSCIEDGKFLEWAEVHGCYYGTPLSEIDRHFALDKDVALELDVQGMRSLREADQWPTTTIFVTPPSMKVLEERLRGRGGLDEEELQLRLLNAKVELNATQEYDHVIVNEDLDRTCATFKEIVRTAREKANP